MDERQSIEMTGDSIDDAVQKGLAALGASPFDVIVEVLDEPSRGVFGIGARPARVRLQRLRPITPPPPPKEEVRTSAVVDTPKETKKETRPAPPPKAQPSKSSSRSAERDPGPASGKTSQRSRTGQPGRGQQREDFGGGRSHSDDDAAYSEELDYVALAGALSDEEIGEDGQAARDTLAELLQHMDVRATVTISRSESTRTGEEEHWLLNVTGSRTDSLIGRKGETLAALQYITRLVVSKRIQRRANVVVDVDSYKSRRSQRLRELAMRMADQAVEQARTVVLEPMPPHERRMIHMALRHRTDVSTKSTGEGDLRKVTIIPSADA